MTLAIVANTRGMHALVEFEATAVRAVITANVEIDGNTGCWLWLGSLDLGGYGRFLRQSTHRLSYAAFNGPIPKGLHIDHVCRVRRCCNPQHLEAVTQAENTRRAVAYLQAHPEERVHHGAKRWCKHGHEFTPDNTGIEKSDGRRRFCKACRRAAVEALRARTQQARGRQWHIDVELFASLADQFPAIEGERLLSTVQASEVVDVLPGTLSSWCGRNPDLAPPLVGRRRRWPESHVRRLLAARTDATWAKHKKVDTSSLG